MGPNCPHVFFVFNSNAMTPQSQRTQDTKSPMTVNPTIFLVSIPAPVPFDLGDEGEEAVAEDEDDDDSRRRRREIGLFGRLRLTLVAL
ncbi:hypothetical protein FRC20_003466 [Serendipita sp. 405]|nr:hypothetical protein FRC20_003466 [Serendipita sp. 405]